MRILVTGSNGLLGQKVVKAAARGHTVLATAPGECRFQLPSAAQYQPLDLTDGPALRRTVAAFAPDALINCAAMTNVDACETDPGRCRALNTEAPAALGHVCQSIGAHLIHLSTDFVFDGAHGPYRETDLPHPISVYGQSKLDGEKALAAAGIPHCVLRTIIIYGVTDGVQRSNLVLWVLNALRAGTPINVVSDQFRQPTLAEDLAAACVRAAEKRATGLYHVCGPETDLHSILHHAHHVARFFNLDESLIRPITSASLNQPARRPPRTGFILDKARQELDYHPRSFQQGLEVVREQLGE